MQSDNRSAAGLVPLRKMASALGVPSSWLRAMAEEGKVPALRAGTRWLFMPDAANRAVVAIAEEAVNGGNNANPQ